MRCASCDKLAKQLEEALAVLQKLARCKVGPRDGDRGEWVDTMLELAADARRVTHE